MKTKSYLTFSIVAALLTTLSIASLSTTQNISAQINNTTNTTAGGDMNMTGQNMTMRMDHQNYKDKKYEKINGTIDIMETMFQAISSKFNVTLPDAITTAEQSVGNNSYAM